MKLIRKSVSVLLALIMAVSLICAVLVSTNAAEETADVNNGIPVLNINIDESAEGYGTIAQMNESPDHSVKCTGTVKLSVPDDYKGDYSDSVLNSTEDLKLDYIRGRGNTTWFMDKKPYKIKLDKKADLLGMGSNKHWVLLANSKDVTLLRNRLIHYIGTALGLEYTPKMLPVDVVMNGEYLGSYYLAEQVRVGSTRVNIDELTDKDNSEPEITGGYMIAYQPYAEENAENVITTDSGLRFQGESPEFYSSDPTDEIGTPEQKSYISEYLQKVENAVYGEDFKDGNGISVWDYMDMQSTADYWWVQEFSKNVDAYATDSTYLYKPRNGKLFWGPLWDFDLSLGNSISETDGFYFSYKMPWLNKLRGECPEYLEMLRERWTEFDKIITDIVKDGGVLDQYAAEIKSSWEANDKIWHTDDYGLGMDFEIDMLRQWLKDRQEWINNNIDSKLGKIYGNVKFVADGKTIQETTVLLGKPIADSVPEAPEKKGYIFNEWQNEDGTAFDSIYPITDDTIITANYLSEKDIIKIENIYFSSGEVWDDISLWNQYLTLFTATPFETNDKIVSWTSSDTDIAEVDSNGLVTEKKTGTVQIIATLRTGLKKSYTLHIYDSTVTPAVEATSIKAAKSEITLNEGEYEQVAVTVAPQPNEAFVYYYSSDDDVAEIDSCGVIHALKEGTATITAFINNEKTVKYKVVVKSTKKADTPKVTKKTNTLKVTKKTKSIKAKNLKTKARTVKPLTISKAKGTVTVKTTSVKLGKKKISVKKFKFTKTGKLTVKKGKYKKGTYKITVKITAKGNSKYKPKTVNKTVNIKIK